MGTLRNGPYLLVRPPTGYPGKWYRGKYAYQHHVVYWRYRGRVPTTLEVVHHKNGDKHDNRIANLEILSKSDHARGHARPTTMVDHICAGCGVAFQRRKGARQYDRTFCCRSHQVTTQQRDRWAAKRAATA